MFKQVKTKSSAGAGRERLLLHDQACSLEAAGRDCLVATCNATTGFCVTSHREGCCGNGACEDPEESRSSCPADCQCWLEGSQCRDGGGSSGSSSSSSSKIDTEKEEEGDPDRCCPGLLCATHGRCAAPVAADPSASTLSGAGTRHALLLTWAMFMAVVLVLAMRVWCVRRPKTALDHRIIIDLDRLHQTISASAEV